MSTIAVRFPKNRIIRKLLKILDFPLAIPSANISSGVSVNAEDVVDEFGKKINFILDGGNSNIGLESTVINLVGRIKILRPGAISSIDISKILKKKIIFQKKLKE